MGKFLHPLYHAVHKPFLRVKWDGTKWGTDWEDLGGVVISELAVTSWEPKRLDLFGIGSDDRLYHHSYDGDSYGWQSTWDSLDGIFTSAPAAVSWGPDRLDVFGLGSDFAMYTRNWDGSKWSEYLNLGGNWASPPAVVSWGAGRLDLFVIGADSDLWHLSFEDGNGWQSQWDSLGGPFDSPPAAVSRDRDRLSVFAADSRGRVWHREWDGDSWQDWEGLGAPGESGRDERNRPQDKGSPDGPSVPKDATGTPSSSETTGGSRTADKPKETESADSAASGIAHVAKGCVGAALFVLILSAWV